MQKRGTALRPTIGLFFALWMTSSAHAGQGSAPDFWSNDVWRDPERPFLFYGESATKRGASKVPPADRPLSDLTTIDAMQAERKRRLSRAVMHPTPENMASYLEINRFVTDKAGAFAVAWRDTLQARPEYDWTVEHPVVNSASTRLAADREQAAIDRVARLDPNTWGLVFFAGADKLTPLMRPLVERFAGLYGLELVTVAVDATPDSVPDAVPDRGLSQRIAGRGLTRLPALVLVHRNDRGPKDARLVASGVVDVMELTRRMARLVENGVSAHEGRADNRQLNEGTTR